MQTSRCVGYVWWCGASSSVLGWVTRCPLLSCLAELCTQEHSPAFCFHSRPSKKGWELGLLQSPGYLKMIVLAEESKECGAFCCQLLSTCQLGPKVQRSGQGLDGRRVLQQLYRPSEMSAWGWQLLFSHQFLFLRRSVCFAGGGAVAASLPQAELCLFGGSLGSVSLAGKSKCLVMNLPSHMLLLLAEAYSQGLWFALAFCSYSSCLWNKISSEGSFSLSLIWN